MEPKCIRCGLTQAQSTERSGIGPEDDSDYDPALGRCYTCHFDFLFEMYGGFLEPAIKAGGMVYYHDGCEADVDPSEE